MSADAVAHAGSSQSSAPPSMVDAVGRQWDYWWTLYQRTWKGGVFSSFVSPVFYVIAMGVLLGGFIEGDPAKLEGATSYLQFIVPGLVAAHAMQTAAGEMTWPVMGMIKWDRTYHSMLATPLSVRDLVAGHLFFAGLRLLVNCGVFMLALIPFGVFQTWWGWLLALLSQVLTGLAWAALTYAFSVRTQDETNFSNYFRLVVMPMMLFSGAFFPVSNLGDVGAFVARLTPLWQGVNLSRMFAVDRVEWPLAVVNVAVLLALLAVSFWWGVVGLSKRLAAES